MRWTFNASYHLGKIIKWLKIFHQLGWAKILNLKRQMKSKWKYWKSSFYRFWEKHITKVFLVKSCTDTPQIWKNGHHQKLTHNTSHPNPPK